MNEIKTRQMPLAIEYMPTAGWLLFIVCPAIYQYNYLDPTFRLRYLIIVVAVGIGFFLADQISKKINRNVTKINAFSGTSLYIMYIAIAVSLLIMFSNIYQIKNIPILAFLMDKNVDLSDERYMATKGLDAPILLKHIYNWGLVVFAPLAIVLSARAGKMWLSIALVVFSALYAVTTSAKFPLIQLSVLVVLGLYATRDKKNENKWNAGYVGIWMLVAIFLIVAAHVFKNNVLENYGSIQNRKNELIQEFSVDDPRATLTLGDMQRLLPDDEKSSIFMGGLKKAVNYLFYRAFLTPVDVSIRWYEYYLAKNHVEGWYSIFSSRGGAANSPSRVVGIWAYQDRFPDHYKSYINAYSSFDADAYARCGFWGVAFASFILYIIRVLGAFCLTQTLLSKVLYGVLIGELFLLPASASVQAILGAQGIAIVVLLMIIEVVYFNFSNKKIV